MNRLLRMYSQLTSLLDRDRAEKENESESSFQIITAPLEYSRANPWDKWRKIRKIGGGANGAAVFLVHSKRNKQNKCALKRIPYKRANEPVELLKEEAAYEDDRSLYLVMELARGGDLYASVMRRRKRYTEEQSAHITKQVLLALADLHRALVVHRDVKIVNVLMIDERTLTVKLGDFGLACSIGNADDYEQCGTRCYMSPETLAHKRVGYPVDVWATGVLVFEIVCGRRPFCSDDEVSEQHHEATIDVASPDAIYNLPAFTRKSPSPELYQFLRGMLDPTPRRRFTAEEALQHRFITRAEGDEDPRSRRLLSAATPGLGDVPLPTADVANVVDVDDDDDDDDDDEFSDADADSDEASGYSYDDDDDDDDDDDNDDNDDDNDKNNDKDKAAATTTTATTNDDDDEDDFQPLYCVCKQPFDETQNYVICDVCDDWLHVRCAGLDEQKVQTLKKFVCSRCEQEMSQISEEFPQLTDDEDADDDVAEAPGSSAARLPHRTRPRNPKRRPRPKDAAIAKDDELPPSDTSTDAEYANKASGAAVTDDGGASSLESEDWSKPMALRRRANLADKYVPAAAAAAADDDDGGAHRNVPPTKAQRFAILNQNERNHNVAAEGEGGGAASAAAATTAGSRKRKKSSGLVSPGGGDDEFVPSRRSQRDGGGDDDDYSPPPSDGLSIEYDDAIGSSEAESGDGARGGGGKQAKKRKKAVAVERNDPLLRVREVRGFSTEEQDVVLAAAAICRARTHPSVAFRDAIVKVARNRSAHLPVGEANAFAARCLDLYNVLILPPSLFVQKQPPRGSTTNLLEIDDETDSESLERQRAPVAERAPRQPRASSVRAAQTIKSFVSDADADNAAEPATPVVSARSSTRRRASATQTPPPPSGTPSTPRRSGRARKPTNLN